MPRLPFRHPNDRAILALAIPALGSLAVDPLVSLVDTAFVGQLGTVELAALGVNTSLFALTFIIFNFLAYGTTPKIGNAIGRGERAEAGRVVVQALALAVLAGVVALAAIQALAHPLLSLMGADGELFEPALTYLRIRAFAGPAVLIMNAGHGAFRGYQDTRTPLIVTVAMNAVNLVLDPLLIFVAGWGLAGAATATLIAQWTGALVFVWLLLVARREAMGVPLELPRLGELAGLLRVGGALIVRTGALVGTLTLATAIAARISVTAVAAHQVAMQLWEFMALVVDALAVAAQALVARHLGESSADARAIADRLLEWGVGVGLLLAVGFLAVRPWLADLFTDDPATAQLCAELFVFVALLQPLGGLVFVWDGIFMAAEDFRYLAAAMVASAGCAAAVLGLTLPMGWGIEGVWWGITTLLAVRAATQAWPYFRRRILA